MKKSIGYAHCDGPCGVYDPASARIAGEAVVSMTKKNVRPSMSKHLRFISNGRLSKYYE